MLAASVRQGKAKSITRIDPDREAIVALHYWEAGRKKEQCCGSGAMKGRTRRKEGWLGGMQHINLQSVV